jgi:hypothetical protein
VRAVIGKAVGAAPWLFLLLAISLQIRAGAILLPGDLFEADPPAHFTTGAMLHDFVRRPSLQPLPFAECFYVQYPKVAFGHWPPVFYVLEAGWFLLFGAKIAAARVLCVCIAAACAVVLYRRCRDRWSAWYAVAACAVFLAFPVIQSEAWRIMSDLLLALFVFLALGSLSDFLIKGERKSVLWLAAWSGIAILTKATGWLLLGPILAGPLIVRRTGVYGTFTYWLGVASIGIISAPYFIWMNSLRLGYPTLIQGHIHRLGVILKRLTVVHYAAGVLLLLVVIALLFRLWRSAEVKGSAVFSIVLSFWVVCQFVFIQVVPMTPELQRYYIPSIAPLAFLIAGAVFKVDEWLESRGLPYGKAVAAILCAAALAASGKANLYSTKAFSKVSASIPVTERPTVLLIESDAQGEGAMIAARLEQDPKRSSYILRSSSALSTSKWSGGSYTLRYKEPVEVREALERNFVTYTVMDTSAPPSPATELVKAVLNDPAAGWQLNARIPVERGPRRRGELLIYRREPFGIQGVPTSVQLGLDRASKVLTCGAR